MPAVISDIYFPENQLIKLIINVRLKLNMILVIVVIYNIFTDALRNFAHLCEPLRNSYYAEVRRETQRYAEN